MPLLQTSFWFGLTPDAPERVPGYAHRYLHIFGDDAARAMAQLCTATTPDRVRDHLAAIADTGADEVILVATTDDVDDLARAADLVSSLA